MTSSKKTPKARRRPSGERPQPPAQQRVRGGFVVVEGLTLADVFDSTDANRLCVIVDIDRCDTAAASTQTFHLMLCEMHDALKRRCDTHPKGAVLRMTDVGVVLRNGDGEVRLPGGMASMVVFEAAMQALGHEDDGDA